MVSHRPCEYNYAVNSSNIYIYIFANHSLCMDLLHSCFYPYWVVLKLIFTFCPAITVGLQQPLYAVDEGSGAVSICAILTGETEKIVTLTLSPIQSTARRQLNIEITCISSHISEHHINRL